MQVSSDSTIALVYLSTDSINFKHFLLLMVKIHLFVNLILQNVAKHIQLTAAETDLFSSSLETRTLKSKQFLLEEGQICKHSTFVQSGCLKGFTVDKNGFEHILSFATTGWWIADMYSLITQQPGQLNIQASSPSEVLLLSKTNQEKLYREVPKFERFFRILTENSLVASQQRVVDNLSLSAEERYEHFCEKYPSLVQSLPQKEIAAYIGVTPEFFSKMRSRLLKGR
jgi:CRP-like cAMP-binding protein